MEAQEKRTTREKETGTTAAVSRAAQEEGRERERGKCLFIGVGASLLRMSGRSFSLAGSRARPA